MKRFKFRLQRVLDYRETLKRECERALARCHMELQQTEETITEILRAQEQDTTSFKDGATFAEFTLSGSYQARLQRDLELEREAAAEAARAVEQAQEVYVEQSRETKVLARLKDNKFQMYRDDSKRDEQKKIDELVVQRHGVQRRSKAE